jgi:hypothetical protein
VIISDKLTQEQTLRLMAILEKHRSTFGYSLQDIKGISPALCTHRIPITRRDYLSCATQWWVSLVQVVPKKGGMTIVKNEKNELIPQRTITG